MGAFGGSFKQTRATTLGAAVVRETLKRAGLAPETIDAAILGNVIQAGNRMNPARLAAVEGGLKAASPALTVNRVCGSGAQAIASAAQEIWTETASAVVAGGMENMDMAPYLMGGGRWGYRMGDAEIYDSMLRDGLHDAFSGKHSGWHTEDLIAKYGITRAAQDVWAERSQKRFAAAQAAGKFAAEITGIEVKAKTGPVVIDKDEANRPDTTLEKLTKLKAVFREGGTLTAGNSPGVNTGAAALVVSSAAFAEKQKLAPVARLVGLAVSGVEPGFFGIAPSPAVRLLLERVGWKLSDIERIEINEAYAAVALCNIKELSLPEDIVNVEGGAVAHGHPIGATGAVLAVRLIHSMRRDGLKRGVVTLCIGGGQGIALALEML